MEGRLIILFVWIAGTWMIFQGTNVLSQGEVSTSSMAVEKFFRSLPLNQTAFKLHGPCFQQECLDWVTVLLLQDLKIFGE